MAELLNCEQSVNNSVSNGMCRLRYGLNENCLLHVFEYLRDFDLINLCKMDVYYKELISEWIIKKKLVNLRRLEDQTEILNVFGKSMRKFTIFTGSFKAMMSLIIKYCEPGLLTEIHMEINDCADRDISDAYEVVYLTHLTLLAMPFFTNLLKLRFETYQSADRNDVFTNFLTQISTTATNLQSLELVTLEPRCNWLQNMRNLVELRFLWTNGSSFDNLFSYLKTGPKLKVFEFRHKLPSLTTICNVLTESCSEHLRVFSDIDESMSTSGHYQHLDKSLIERYAFLSKFSHLSHVTLMTYTFCGSDLYYALMSLAKKDIVKLKIVTAFSRNVILSDEVNKDIMRRRLPQFARLNSVEIEIREPNAPVDSKWTQCDLRCQFMFHFLRQVNSLQHFTFTGTSLTNMDKVLEHVPHIRSLDISNVSSLQTLTVVSNIVEMLRKRRQLADGENEHGIFHLTLRDSFDVRNFVKNIDLKDAMITFTLTTLRSWD